MVFYIHLYHQVQATMTIHSPWHHKRPDSNIGVNADEPSWKCSSLDNDLRISVVACRALAIICSICILPSGPSNKAVAILCHQCVPIVNTDESVLLFAMSFFRISFVHCRASAIISPSVLCHSYSNEPFRQVLGIL